MFSEYCFPHVGDNRPGSEATKRGRAWEGISPLPHQGVFFFWGTQSKQSVAYFCWICWNIVYPKNKLIRKYIHVHKTFVGCAWAYHPNI